MHHAIDITYRRIDGTTQPDGFGYATWPSTFEDIARDLQALQTQGQFIVGIRFACERQGSRCICQCQQKGER